MSFLDIFKPLLGPILDPILRLIPDPNARKEAQEKIEQSLIDAGNAAMMAQIEVDKAEASNPSMFVAGARPFILWVCGIGIAWEFVGRPFVSWGAFLFGVDLTAAPNLDATELMNLITAMLGLSAYRTYEGIKGVKRENMQAR